MLKHYDDSMSLKRSEYIIVVLVIVTAVISLSDSGVRAPIVLCASVCHVSLSARTTWKRLKNQELLITHPGRVALHTSYKYSTYNLYLSDFSVSVPSIPLRREARGRGGEMERGKDIMYLCSYWLFLFSINFSFILLYCCCFYVSL